jgi:hypothetical protein
MKKLNKQGIKDYRSDHHSLAFAASTGARKTRYDSEGKHYNGYPDIFDRNLLGISKNEHQLTKRMLPVHQSLRRRKRGLESQKRREQRRANQEYAAFSDTLMKKQKQNQHLPSNQNALPEHVRGQFRGALTELTKRREGDRVKAKVEKFWTKFYSGEITRVNSDGTYDIKFDDGERKRGVTESQIEDVRVPGESKVKHRIGSKIAAFLGTSGSGGRRKTRKHKKRRRRKTRLHRKTKRKTKKTRRKRKTRKRN